MSDTPRMAAVLAADSGGSDFIANLACEGNTLERELAAASERIARLVKIGDAIVENGSVSESMFDEWSKAKESKP